LRLATKSQHTFSTGAPSVTSWSSIRTRAQERQARRPDRLGDLPPRPASRLQASAEALYDWEPALQEIPRFSAPLIYSGENVRIPFGKRDTIFSTSLVLLF